MDGTNKEHSKGYGHKDILNMDESRCFLKALATKDLPQKGKKIKGGKSLSRGSQLHFSPVQMEKELVNQLSFGGVKHEGVFD